MPAIEIKKEYMLEAIRQAKIAKKEGDYAIGAVLVKEGKIIASRGNRSLRDESPIAHAEILVIIKGCEQFKSRHLSDCILYTTHEPCSMCTSVAIWAKLQGIVYGARIEDMENYRQRNGNDKFLWRTIAISCADLISKSTEKIEIIKDFMREECVKLFHN